MNNDLKNGFISNVTISFSVFTYGTVLGIIASQKGIEFYELILMNSFIFAGSAQFVIVDMWQSSLDILGIITAALMINLRYFLITASLHPLFINSSKKQKLKYMHFVTDENWAITINRMQKEKITPAFLLGGGICIFSSWMIGTIIGFNFGGFISDPSKYGLDFAFVAIFTAVVVNMYKGKSNILPWLIAAIVALICEHFIDGKLYIIVGALAGSLSTIYLKDKNA